MEKKYNLGAVLIKHLIILVGLGVCTNSQATSVYTAGVGIVGSAYAFEDTNSGGATASGYTSVTGDHKVFGSAIASGRTITTHINITHNPEAWFFSSYDEPQAEGRVRFDNVIFSSLDPTENGFIDVSANFHRSRSVVTKFVKAKLDQNPQGRAEAVYSIAIGGSMSLFQPPSVCAFNCGGGSYSFPTERISSGTTPGANVTVPGSVVTDTFQVLLNTPYTFEFFYSLNQVSADASVIAELNFLSFNLQPGYQDNLTAVPLPASVWFFSSALLCFFTVSSKRKNSQVSLSEL